MGNLRFPSGSGIPYPRSGQLVGHAADFLRLKGYLKDDWAGGSYKTAQRYFKGEHVHEVRDILRTLVDALVPSSASVTGAIAESPTMVCDWITDAIHEVLGQWDAFAGSMNGVAFPLVDRRLAPIPFLRLGVLDLGIRWAAFLVHSDSQPRPESPWLAPNCLGVIIDELRGKRLTIEALAERTNVSINTVMTWRTGVGTPTNANLHAIASALGADNGATTLQLRIAAAVTACRNYLAKNCGEERIDDLVSALTTTIRLAHRALTFAPLPPHARAGALRELIHQGARAPAGSRLSTLLAESSPLNQEVQADFLALPGSWVARLTYWAKAIASLKHAPEELPLQLNISEERAKQLALGVEVMFFRMSNFDQPTTGMSTMLVKGDAFTSAMNRVIQADRATSIGDRSSAIHHYRRAVKLQPQNAELHFSLGAQLGQCMAHGDRSCLEEALHECRIACELRPDWDVPRTEIGVILSNAGLSEEAEIAFVEAEPLALDNAHFHQARGINLLWLRRHSEAAVSLKAALDRAKESLELRVRLAAALSHLGRDKEVKRLAVEIQHRGGPVVKELDDWKQFVPTQPWRRPDEA